MMIAPMPTSTLLPMVQPCSMALWQKAPGASACVVALGLLISAPAPAADLVSLEEQAMRSAVQRVAPSTVRIEAIGRVEHLDGKLLGSGPTSGLIISPDGYILSSAFGLVGNPTSILVTLPSGTRLRLWSSVPNRCPRRSAAWHS